jgi:hypothetical protein
MDALSDVLRLMRLTGAVFMDAEFTAPWCIGEPSGVEVCVEHMPNAQHVVIYHLVTEGECQVGFEGEAPRCALSGDLVIIPGGEKHSLGSDLSRPRADGARLVVARGPDEAPQVRHGGGGAVTRLVCGYLACDSALFDAILAPLPRGSSTGAGAQWLHSSIRSASPSPRRSARAGTVLAKHDSCSWRRYAAISRNRLLRARQWLAGLPTGRRQVARARARAGACMDRGRAATASELSRSGAREQFTDLVGTPPCNT